MLHTHKKEIKKDINVETYTKLNKKKEKRQNDNSGLLHYFDDVTSIKSSLMGPET